MIAECTCQEFTGASIVDVVCMVHGCSICGAVILANTEDWARPLCPDCHDAIGAPSVEPATC